MFILYATQDGVSQKIHWSYFSNCYIFHLIAWLSVSRNVIINIGRAGCLTSGQWQKICKIFKLYDLCLGTAFPPNPENLHQVKSFNFKESNILTPNCCKCTMYIVHHYIYFLYARSRSRIYSCLAQQLDTNFNRESKATFSRVKLVRSTDWTSRALQPKARQGHDDELFLDDLTILG